MSDFELPPTAVDRPPPLAVSLPLDEAVARLPAQPKTMRDTGLEPTLLVELVTKAVNAVGRIHLPVLAGKLRLSINVLREILASMATEQLIEVSSRGDSELDVYYQLTGHGRQRAAEFLARCRYVGPAPVTLDAYCDQIARQSTRQSQLARISAADMAAAFADDVLDAAVREQLGAALQSSRALLLYGPSGSGKSTLAHKLGRLQRGLVAVPYAVLVGQAIVQVHDPLVHVAPAQSARQSEERRSSDSRWTLCQRPVLHLGAELAADMLELRYDEGGGMHRAPVQLLANNGMLVVDDLGRQRIGTPELLNRWSKPLVSGTDHLTLGGGLQLSIPFDVTVLFATNIAPHLLLDESSMRRVGYKIAVGALSEPAYRALFRRECRRAGLALDEAALEHLIRRLHGAACRPLLASYPAELVGRLLDFAAFAGAAPRLTIAALEQAWTSMFAGTGSGAPAPALTPVPYFTACADPLLEKIS